MSQDIASHYINVARRFGNQIPKNSEFKPTVLYALAAPSTPDDMLRKMADRIQARAIRRCGELLKQIEPAKNQHDAENRARVGNYTSRSQEAKEAGLSPFQKVTALRVANVPQTDFEDAVESEKPPTNITISVTAYFVPA